MIGQVIRRGDSVWMVRIPLGRDANGKRKYHNRTIHGTKREAEKYRTKKLRELDTGAFVETSQQGLSAYLNDWLTTVAAPRVRPRTLEDYRTLLERYICPVIGDRKLSQLSPADIQRVYAGMLASGLSARTVRYAHSVLSSALDQAVLWRTLAHNPAKLVTLPRQERREMASLSAIQGAQFVQATRGTRFEALWILLLTAGLRPGEALALKWADFAGDKIQLQRSLSWSNNGDWELCEPKTARARRVVVLPPSTTLALQAHRKQQAQERLSAGPNWQPLDLVFANSTGGPLEWRIIARRYFKPLLIAAKLPANIRPYDLRHTCATLLLASGENVKVVSERMGHSSASLTLDVYSHTLPDMQQGAANKLQEILFA